MIDPVIDFTLRCCLAGLLATAAWHKLSTPYDFWRALSGYQIAPAFAERALVFLVPIAEIAVAASLLFLPGSGAAAMVLWTAYGTAIALNILRGRRQIECGCGGLSTDQNIHWGLVIRNAVLVALAAITLLPTASRDLVWFDLMTIVFFGTVLLLLYAATDILFRNHGLLQDNEVRP